MSIKNKYIKQWKRIFLDTTVICQLFSSENPNLKDEDVFFTRLLVDYLSNSKTETNENRTFLVSTITVTELLTKENDQEKIQRIIRVLNSENVEFVDFDLETALAFNIALHPYLSKPELHKFAKNMGFLTNDFAMAREWISRDYMIIMSAIINSSDVALTADKRTFYPLTQNAGQACALTYPSLYQKEGTVIMKYYEEKVPELLQPVKQKTGS